MVDGNEAHSVVRRTARHHALIDLLARGFASASIPVTKETTGLFRSGGK